MHNPKVSVIVPIYKVEKYLTQCIESILNQTLKDIEVILVDEGDMDACRFIIDHYEKVDERVKAIHEKSGGYAPSVNKGLDAASGEYISIIESDDFIKPDMLESMYNKAKEFDADVVKTPYMEYYDKKGNAPERTYPCFWMPYVERVPEGKLFSIEEYPELMSIHPSIWSCIYKKSYFDKYNIRFLDTRGAYVDHSFKVLSLLNTDRILWLNKPFYFYRLSNTEASASQFNISAAIKRWNEFHKLMERDFKGKYEKIVEYNFREECVNTFQRLLDGYFLSEEDAEMLKENLSYTTLEQIKGAKNIHKSILKEFIRMKKNPKIIDKYIKKQGAKKKAGEREFKLFGLIPIFTIKEVKRETEMLKLFGCLPFVKIKTRALGVKKYYLLGLILIGRLSGVENG